MSNSNALARENNLPSEKGNIDDNKPISLRGEPPSEAVDAEGGVLHHPHSVPTLSTQIWACASYGLVSVSLTITQKTVFHSYNFAFPNTVTLLQIFTSLALLHGLRYSRAIDFVDFSVDTARKVFPLAFMWWMYVVTGVCALRHLTVPMFSVLRRVTTLLVVVGEFVMFSKLPTPASGGSLLLMCTGAIVAGMTDMTFSLPGYIYISLCVVSTAMYLLLIRRLRDVTGLNEMSLLYYNNILGLPMMTAWLILGTDELSRVLDYPHLLDPSFLSCLMFSASQAFVLNMCIFRCTSINSPLATSVTGQIKDIATTSLGMLLFGDVIINVVNIIGLGIGLLGGMVYAAVSYYNSVRAAKAAKKNTTI
eukprot:CAMPEP_0114241372 /NCGR_PEP_ID=MMETSP0058-20121206/9597_1 /TAXON_ID=36894 /ORGANISM="Pyramimonas parkeae, CCMP726" /LENGTH=363 /DNA_ID=CAMNT_0001353893 /DNA_START=528 /DNA_END=1619 /DNA_ORIENTATION=-